MCFYLKLITFGIVHKTGCFENNIKLNAFLLILAVDVFKSLAYMGFISYSTNSDLRVTSEPRAYKSEAHLSEVFRCLNSGNWLWWSRSRVCGSFQLLALSKTIFLRGYRLNHKRSKQGLQITMGLRVAPVDLAALTKSLFLE
jgi:hypothetical protein